MRRPPNLSWQRRSTPEGARDVTRSLAAVSVGWLGLSAVADGVPALLVPHQVLAAGGDASQLGLITLTAITLAALAQPFAGAWSDRVGAGPAIAGGVVVAGAGLALILVSVMVGTVVALVGTSVAQAGYQRLLPDRVPPRARGRGAGAKGLFDLAGAFFAFSVLAALLADGSVAMVAAILGAVMSGSLGAALLMHGKPPTVAPPTRPASKAVILDRGAFAATTAARFLFLLGVYAVGRFLVGFVADRLGLEANAAAGEAGALLAVLALATAVAALPAGWLADRAGRAPTMLAGGLLAAIGIGGLPFAGETGGMLLSGVLVAVGTATFGAGSWATVADLSAGGGSGRLMGIANFGTAGAAAAAGLFGPIIDAGNTASPGAGYGLAFAVAAAAAAIGGVLGWWASRGAYSHPALAEVPD